MQFCNDINHHCFDETNRSVVIKTSDANELEAFSFRCIEVAALETVSAASTRMVCISNRKGAKPCNIPSVMVQTIRISVLILADVATTRMNLSTVATHTILAC